MAISTAVPEGSQIFLFFLIFADLLTILVTDKPHSKSCEVHPEEKLQKGHSNSLNQQLIWDGLTHNKQPSMTIKVLQRTNRQFYGVYEY